MPKFDLYVVDNKDYAKNVSLALAHLPSGREHAVAVYKNRELVKLNDTVESDDYPVYRQPIFEADEFGFFLPKSLNGEALDPYVFQEAENIYYAGDLSPVSVRRFLDALSQRRIKSYQNVWFLFLEDYQVASILDAKSRPISATDDHVRELFLKGKLKLWFDHAFELNVRPLIKRECKRWLVGDCSDQLTTQDIFLLQELVYFIEREVSSLNEELKHRYFPAIAWRNERITPFPATRIKHLCELGLLKISSIEDYANASISLTNCAKEIMAGVNFLHTPVTDLYAKLDHEVEAHDSWSVLEDNLRESTYKFFLPFRQAHSDWSMTDGKV
ncbi:hypothetical protein ACYPKM_05495 [Pseudomonas aeruginosa]